MSETRSVLDNIWLIHELLRPGHLVYVVVAQTFCMLLIFDRVLKVGILYFE